MYLDGGTISMTLCDSLGREYRICRDSRMNAPAANLGRFFADAAYPTDAGARVLSARSSAPHAARVLAKVWVRRNFSRQERVSLLVDKNYVRRSSREVVAYAVCKYWGAGT